MTAEIPQKFKQKRQIKRIPTVKKIVKLTIVKLLKKLLQNQIIIFFYF